MEGRHSLSYSLVPLSRERICSGKRALVGCAGMARGRRREEIEEGLTPLLETHTVVEEWSNMRIWNGRVSS